MKSKYKSGNMKTLIRVLAKQACKTKTLIRVWQNRLAREEAFGNSWKIAGGAVYGC